MKKRNHPQPANDDEYNYYNSLRNDGLPCIEMLQKYCGYHSYLHRDDHRHAGCVEIILCAKGHLEVLSGGEPTAVKPEQMIVIPETTSHCIARFRDTLVYYDLIVRTDIPKPMLNLPTPESECLRTRLRNLQFAVCDAPHRVRSLFHRLIETHRSLDVSPERSLALRAGVLQLILEILDCSTGGSEKSHPNSRIAALVEEIEAHPEKTLDRDELAARANMSYSTFNSLFRKFTGLPPHSFVLLKRMEKARRLLRETDESIVEIANLLGFSSSQHFTTKFRRICGTTPLQFRNCRPMP